MAATPSSNPKSSGDDRNTEAVPLTFEDKLNQFWQKNRTIVFGLCLFVLVAILGKGMWERSQAAKEREIESAYATANTPDQLRAFAAAHPDHELAGIAQLRIADEAYANGKYADAAAGYDKVASTLKSGPLAARALLGRGLAKIQSGKTTDGMAELKQLLNDTTQLKTIRVEAAYQLASAAAEAGNSADAQKYIDQLNQIEPAGLWARRALALQASLPKPTSLMSVPAGGAPAATSSTASTVPAAKEQSGPNVQVKLPTK